MQFSTTVALFILFIGSRQAGTSSSPPGAAAHADSASSSSSSSLSSAGALEKNDSRPSSSGTTGTQDPDTDDDNSDDEETNASAFATFVGDGGGAFDSEEKNEGERDEDALQAELANAAQAWSQDVLLPGGPLLPGLHIATLKWHSLSQLSQMIYEKLGTVVCVIPHRTSRCISNKKIASIRATITSGSNQTCMCCNSARSRKKGSTPTLQMANLYLTS